MFDERTRPIRLPRRQRRVSLRAMIVVLVLVVTAVVGYTVLRRTADGQPGPGKQVATVVVDRQKGAKVADSLGGEQFRTASVVKLLIAVDVVAKGAPQKAGTTQLDRMLSASDDATANSLWTQNGGPAIITRTAATIGLRHTFPPSVPGRWGDTLSTADDIVAIYQYILKLPKAKRNPILTPLRKAPRIAADGFDQHFGIPTAFQDRPWAAKQGWASGRGAVDLHTTGLVGENDRYIVVILSSSPEGTAIGSATTKVTTVATYLAPLLKPS